MRPFGTRAENQGALPAGGTFSPARSIRASSWRKPVCLLAVAAIVVALPQVISSPYYILILGSIGIAVILSLSLGLLYGYTGQMSFAHGAFYGIGAYTAALLTSRAQVSFGLAVLAGMFAAGFIAYLAGRPTLRLTGHYLAIATLALQVAISQFFTHASAITNGTVGVFGIVRPRGFESDANYTQLILVLAILCTIVSARVVGSRFGRALLIVRHDETEARAVGVNPAHYKVTVFVLSASMAGLAGALYAHQILFISPVTFDINQSILILSMVVIGGLASNFGAILGAVAVTLVTQLLFNFGDLSFLIYGFWIVIVIVFFPAGLVGIFRSLQSISRRLPVVSRVRNREVHQ
ncbi:branched-chain amino acid ABC transporter permease [Arthrobacter sp. GCM10027362]|uniref:branched-chain amino acid ABC transporter permease n=1 Tax=Arthrobacter sp. GCM10027362 TaxID=3273379 RepID=UPI00362CB0FE